MKKQKNKFKLPEKDVEYTFAIGGKLSKRVFLKSEPTATGSIRLIFQNTEDNYVYKGGMSVWQFNEYIRKNQIINEKRLKDYVATRASMSDKTSAGSGEELWQNTINRIRSIPEVLNAYVVQLIGYTPRELVKEMYKLDDGCHTKEYEYRVMRNVNAVVKFLDKYDFETSSENVMRETQDQKEALKPAVEEAKEASERAGAEIVINRLKSISQSMSKKCKARFGYPVSELIEEFKNIAGKDKTYIDSIYKEADRIFYYVGYKKPAMA